MSLRARRTAFVVVAIVLVLVVGVSVALAVDRAAARAELVPTVAVTSLAAMAGTARIVFRSTEIGQEYGVVAMVSLDDPSGPRAFTDVPCDRVDATADGASCLRTLRGLATRYEAVRLDADWAKTESWPLPGIPSRTRLSDDGTRLATTAFVTGHSYMQVGFSTTTAIHGADGPEIDDLEDFALVIDGRTVTPIDRNVWGVTFADDDTFYATVATGGEHHLVRGSLTQRTLRSIRTGVECPSLSPDGTRIAFKVARGGSTPTWGIAVLDLSTGEATELAGETRSVDDQVEWLDDDTLLYGLPRAQGDGDVWSVDTESDAEPTLFIEHASSPSVVRG